MPNHAIMKYLEHTRIDPDHRTLLSQFSHILGGTARSLSLVNVGPQIRRNLNHAKEKKTARSHLQPRRICRLLQLSMSCWLVVCNLHRLGRTSLPNSSTVQVLEMLIAIVVGGGVLGLARLFPVSFWGFVGFFVMALTVGLVLWMNHKRTVSARQPSDRPNAGASKQDLS